MASRARLAVFGSTGSVGRQVLEVVDAFAESLQVTCLTTGESTGLLAQQCQTYRPKLAVVATAGAASELENALNGLGTEVLFGPEALLEAAASDVYDVALMAIAGVAALEPTLEILRQRKKLALANKESLVAGGHLIMREAQLPSLGSGNLAAPTRTVAGQSDSDGSTGCERAALIPVDSEHSALYQLLGEVDVGEVAGITLTASGGPFLNVPKSELCNASPQMALRHPTWQMGPKVTVDSASLMNKGLEVIEASWLFALPPSQIQVLIHPQSVVHSFLNLTDGTSLAQLSLPDMRIPIQYALLGRQRSPYPALALPACGPLSFEEPDPDRFPCLLLAYRAAQMGGTAPAVLSAADEEAVRLFLEGKICFTGIAKAVEATLDKHTPVENPTLEEVLAADAWGRQEVRIYWQASRG